MNNPTTQPDDRCKTRVLEALAHHKKRDFQGLIDWMDEHERGFVASVQWLHSLSSTVKALMDDGTLLEDLTGVFPSYSYSSPTRKDACRIALEDVVKTETDILAQYTREELADALDSWSRSIRDHI